METRHQLAILVAGALVGAQIGFASIDTTIPETAQHMEPVAGEAEALESGTAGEPTEVAAEPSAAADESASISIAEAQQPILPVAARHLELPSVFPASGDELQMLPAMADYLARIEHQRFGGASPNVYPAFVDEQPMLPAMAAFLEQRDGVKLAAQTQPAAGNEVAASGANGAATAAGQEPAEIAALEPRSPWNGGTPF